MASARRGRYAERVSSVLDVDLRSTLDGLLEGCQVVDRDYRYVYVNATAAAHGRSTVDELVGRRMTDCYPGIEGTAMYAVLGEAMRERRSRRMTNEFTYPDGKRGVFELQFIPSPEGVMIFSLDATEEHARTERLRRTEERLNHVQRLEAVGRLASAVTHDFNNLLHVILTNSELATLELPSGTLAREYVDEIAAATRRASELTGQLLGFARKQVLAPRELDVNELVRGVEPMIRRLAGRDVTLTIDLHPDLGRIRADRSQLEQALLNLVVNARDAMPSGGSLRVATGHSELDEAHAALHPPARSGEYVTIAVTDSGTGMDAETRARIFEPFFTTKPEGQGTGLGLATVYGTVSQMGGTVWVYSQVGKGTTFRLFMPRIDAAATSSDDAALAGDETLLVVDDDDGWRVAACRALQARGYAVLEAASGREALAIADGACSLDLIVADLDMPGMNGVQLIAELRRRRPSLSALVVSGAGQLSADEAALTAPVARLDKPFTPLGLARAVRSVLAGGARGARR